MSRQTYLSPIKELVKLYFIFVVIFTAGRVALFAIYYERIKSSGTEYWYAFLYGLKMDTMSTSYLLIVPASLLLLLPKFSSKIAIFSLRLYLLIALLLLLYLENATFPFLAEFDVRPNAIFINYLEYPREVLSNIWASYKIELFIAFAMMAIFGRLFWIWSLKRYEPLYELPLYKRIPTFLLVATLLFIGIRSSFGHRPANISDAVFTNSHLVNEITKNTPYALGYTIYSQKKHGANAKVYGSMQISVALKRVGRALNIPLSKGKIPFLRAEKSSFPSKRRKNLVVLIEESMGAQFVGALGGEKGITPNFDKLAKEGILFKDLYSNGTRSVRGLAGVVAGFLPVPGKGVVKRNRSQRDFFTIAQLLKPYGYHASFIYGGEKRFDNMASWFYGNGFDEIIDETMYENPIFRGIWGVSDEDLILRAHQKYSTLSKEKRPFVSVMFTSTNHTPFEFPDGRIELVEGVPKNSVKNAIKFADFAIGKFIELAKKSEYWENTIFVIVSDHNVRVYGDDLVPVKMFHIPALILGGGIEPKVVKKIATQPDVIATAIDLLGADFSHPILGQSIFKNETNSISLMQFHDMYALRKNSTIAVAQPNKDMEFFSYKNGALEASKADNELAKDLLAYITVIAHLYEKRLHTLKTD